MFSQKNDTDKNTSTAMTLISAETSITGDVDFTGAVIIEGSIQGNIQSDQGQLKVIDTARIDGDIHAQNIVIYGTVNGNVYAEEYLELIAGAVVNGTVFYNQVEVERGAQVNGSMEYRANSHSAKKTLSESTENTDSNVREVIFKAER
ncbi:MAG: bactofilin family protein [Endozoicomonas sp.]